jgi:hypothetical protein
MRRNLIAGLAAAAVAATALGATVVFGADSSAGGRAALHSVDVAMGPSGRAAPERTLAAKAKKKKKPKVVYLGGSGTINTATTGPFIDFGLDAPKNLCPRVIDGGIRLDDTRFYQQGSYVEGGEYHVLVGLGETAAQNATPVSSGYTTHLVCLKGVK